MTMPLPLELTYAAIFGSPPGPEVAATLVRLDHYLGRALAPSTAIMLCISLRPIDLYVAAISAAERQMHDARLMLQTGISEIRSTEAWTITVQNETIRRLSEENRILRQIAASRKSEPQSPIITATILVMLSIGAIGVCWAGLIR